MNLPQDRGAEVACRQADVACGTSAPMRRGTEAMWQGRAWPTQGEQSADTWQEATRVHAGLTRLNRIVVEFTQFSVKKSPNLTNL